jgi:hypothetical protein
MTEEEQRQMQMKALFQALKALQDGKVTVKEGADLCRAGVTILSSLRPNAKKYWAKIALDTACIVLKDIAEDIEQMEETNG